MNTQTNTPWSLLASLIVVLIGGGLLWRATLGFQAFTWERYRQLAVRQDPIPIPDVPLQDQDGRFFTPALLKGQLVLVNFIYTRCTSLCTVSGTVYAHLLRTLQSNTGRAQVRLLSISLDPDYDTPARLREYRTRYTRRPNGHWLVARPVNSRASAILLKRFGVVRIPDGLGGYKHSTAVHLLDRRGRLVQIIADNDLDKILQAVDARLKRGQ
jgi:protein SCO1/2